MSFPTPSNYPSWEEFGRALVLALTSAGVTFGSPVDTRDNYASVTSPDSFIPPANFTPLWISNADGELFLGNSSFNAPTAESLFQIDNFNLVDAAITTRTIADNAINTQHIVNNAVTEATLSTGAVTATKLAESAVTFDKIANGAVVSQKLANLSVDAAKLAAQAVGSVHISLNAVQTTHIADAAINTAKIGLAAIQSANIAQLAVGTVHIADGAISSVKIGQAAIGSVNIGDAVILNSHVQNGAITTAKIGDAAIVTALINDAAIVTAKIDDLAVNGAKIANAAISSAKIANLAVGNAQLAGQISSFNFDAANNTGWQIDRFGNISGQSIVIHDQFGGIAFAAGQIADRTVENIFTQIDASTQGVADLLITYGSTASSAASAQLALEQSNTAAQFSSTAAQEATNANNAAVASNQFAAVSGASADIAEQAAASAQLSLTQAQTQASAAGISAGQSAQSATNSAGSAASAADSASIATLARNTAQDLATASANSATNATTSALASEVSSTVSQQNAINAATQAARALRQDYSRVFIAGRTEILDQRSTDVDNPPASHITPETFFRTVNNRRSLYHEYGAAGAPRTNLRWSLPAVAGRTYRCFADLSNVNHVRVFIRTYLYNGTGWVLTNQNFGTIADTFSGVYSVDYTVPEGYSRITFNIQPFVQHDNPGSRVDVYGIWIEDYTGVIEAEQSAAVSLSASTAAVASQTAAQTFAAGAQNSAITAQTAFTGAVNAQTAAGNSLSATQAAQANAEQAATAAGNSLTSVLASQAVTENAATAALLAQEAAQQEAIAAETARNQAVSSANAANTATQNAQNIATTVAQQALQAQQDLLTALEEADAAILAANTAANNAQAFAGTATNAANNSAQSSTTAQAAATTATTQADLATTARQAADAANGLAGNSAAAAASSETAASSFATSAGASSAAAQTAVLSAQTASNNSASSAAIATAAAAAANSAAASAEASSSLAASLATGFITPNADFTLFSDPNFPTYWRNWTGAAAEKTRVAGSNPQVNALRIVAPAGATSGILRGANDAPTSIGSISGNQWLVMEMDATLNAGTFRGAGTFVQVQQSAGATGGFRLSMTGNDINGEQIGDGIVGARRKVAYLFQTPANAISYTIFLMNHWPFFFGDNNASADRNDISQSNDITWHKFGIREANPAEINLGVALPELQASVSVVQAALVTLEQTSVSYSIAVQATGSEDAIFELQAGTNGSAARIIAAEVWIGNKLDPANPRPAIRVVNNQPILSGAILRGVQVAPTINSTVLHEPQLRPRIVLAEHGDTIDFGGTYETPPTIVPDLTGLPTLAAGQQYAICAKNIGLTSATAQVQQIVAGSPVTRTSAAGTLNNTIIPNWRAQKPHVDDASNGFYQFRLQMTGESDGELEGGSGNFQSYSAVVDLYIWNGTQLIKFDTVTQFWGGSATQTVNVTGQYTDAVGLAGGSGFEFGAHAVRGTINTFTHVQYSSQTQSQPVTLAGLIPFAVHAPSAV